MLQTPALPSQSLHLRVRQQDSEFGGVWEVYFEQLDGEELVRSGMFPELAEGAEGGSGTKAQVASGLRPHLRLVKGRMGETAPGQRRSTRSLSSTMAEDGRVLGGGRAAALGWY